MSSSEELICVCFSHTSCSRRTSWSMDPVSQIHPLIAFEFIAVLPPCDGILLLWIWWLRWWGRSAFFKNTCLMIFSYIMTDSIILFCSIPFGCMDNYDTILPSCLALLGEAVVVVGWFCLWTPLTWWRFHGPLPKRRLGGITAGTPLHRSTWETWLEPEHCSDAGGRTYFTFSRSNLAIFKLIALFPHQSVIPPQVSNNQQKTEEREKN